MSEVDLLVSKQEYLSTQFHEFSYKLLILIAKFVKPKPLVGVTSMLGFDNIRLVLSIMKNFSVLKSVASPLSICDCVYELR